MLQTVNCQTNTGGSLTVDVTGADGVPLSLLWNTTPVQTSTIISGLSEGFYSVQISGTDVCPLTATGKAEKIFLAQAFISLLQLLPIMMARTMALDLWEVYYH